MLPVTMHDEIPFVSNRAGRLRPLRLTQGRNRLSARQVGDNSVVHFRRPVGQVKWSMPGHSCCLLKNNCPLHGHHKKAQQ
jgi:hypothetical protein